MSTSLRKVAQIATETYQIDLGKWLIERLNAMPFALNRLRILLVVTSLCDNLNMDWSPREKFDSTSR